MSIENYLKELENIISQLRLPESGCPWDRAQNHVTLIPYILEEAYEVVDAIRFGTDKDLIEELGDLLFQILLHAQIAKEENKFKLEDIEKKLIEKMIYRHPHVFKEKQELSLIEIEKNWEVLKKKEKPMVKSLSPISDDLKQKIRSQPAFLSAMKISNKAAKEGFEFENIENIMEKLSEEIEEFKIALSNKDQLNAKEELGDILFTIINIARWTKLDPEECLTLANKKFIERFQYIEEQLPGDLSKKSKLEMKNEWNAAKLNIKK